MKHIQNWKLRADWFFLLLLFDERSSIKVVYSHFMIQKVYFIYRPPKMKYNFLAFSMIFFEFLFDFFKSIVVAGNRSFWICSGLNLCNLEKSQLIEINQICLCRCTHHVLKAIEKITYFFRIVISLPRFQTGTEGEKSELQKTSSFFCLKTARTEKFVWSFRTKTGNRIDHKAHYTTRCEWQIRMEMRFKKARNREKNQVTRFVRANT